MSPEELVLQFEGKPPPEEIFAEQARYEACDAMVLIFPVWWWIVLAATIGLAVSPAPIAFYSIGVLMQPLSEAFGWSMSEISLAATLLTIAIVLTTPVIGILVGRIGPKKVLIPSMLGCALS